MQILPFLIIFIPNCQYGNMAICTSIAEDYIYENDYQLINVNSNQTTASITVLDSFKSKDLWEVFEMWKIGYSNNNLVYNKYQADSITRNNKLELIDQVLEDNDLIELSKKALPKSNLKYDNQFLEASKDNEIFRPQKVTDDYLTIYDNYRDIEELKKNQTKRKSNFWTNVSIVGFVAISLILIFFLAIIYIRKKMKQNAENNQLIKACIVISLSLIIAILLLGKLSYFIGFLAYPIVLIGAFGIGKLLYLIIGDEQ